MKNSLLVVVIVALLSGCISWVFAKTDFPSMPKGTYRLDKTHASLVWKVSHMGLSRYTALFTDIDATINYNPADIESSFVRATIDPRSVETHFPFPDETDFNATLATDSDWFNADDYAEIEFVSTDITLHSPSSATMEGTLTMLGVTRPVTLAVTLNGAMANQPLSGKPTLGFSATTTIKRSAWGMTKYIPTIGDEVAVTIEAEFAK